MGNKTVALIITITLIIMLLCGCVTSSGLKGTAPKADSPFLDYFESFSTEEIMIGKGKITILEYITLPETAVLDTGEAWTIDFNGNFIDCDSGLVFDIQHGGIQFEDSYKIPSEELLDHSNQYDYLGGISVLGVAINIGPEGSCVVRNGNIDGEDYAITVSSGGSLTIYDGEITGYELPIFAEDGWIGTLSGGLYSEYDPSYEYAISSGRYISMVFNEEYEDFAWQWDQPFHIDRKGTYSGTSQLSLTAQDGLSACFRLYKTYKANGFGGASNQPDYQWFARPGQTIVQQFTSGSYVLKVAEGAVWSDTDAFGEDGYYWYMDPFEFQDNYGYQIETVSTGGSSRSDDKNGFLSGIK